MRSFILVFAIFCQFSIGECFNLSQVLHVTNLTHSIQPVLNRTKAFIAKTLHKETTLANFTYTLHDDIDNSTDLSFRSSEQQVDCLGLGKLVARTLEWFFKSQPNGTHALDVQFLISSRNQPQRVRVVLGSQFGLEWTDFKIERRTVIIVHGFLSHGQETWIKNMEQALFDWGDVNVVVIDWSAGGNTWNYYKAAINTKIVGYQISKFIEHITNITINEKGPDTSNWGPLHLIGHSLGSHICGFAAKELKKRQNKWTVQRITSLDPAQPCFRNADPSAYLHKTDAPFVDVIHTNGRLLYSLGLGLPGAIGHIDFYPNGGKIQPGCIRAKSYFDFLPIPTVAIEQAICSHGRSYMYFTESLIAATTHNCSFWGYRWNLTHRHFLQPMTTICHTDNCTEMGIKAELYDQHGTFYVTTASQSPFCVLIP